MPHVKPEPKPMTPHELAKLAHKSANSKMSRKLANNYLLLEEEIYGFLAVLDKARSNSKPATHTRTGSSFKDHYNAWRELNDKQEKLVALLGPGEKSNDV